MVECPRQLNISNFRLHLGTLWNYALFHSWLSQNEFDLIQTESFPVCKKMGRLMVLLCLGLVRWPQKLLWLIQLFWSNYVQLNCVQLFIFKLNGIHKAFIQAFNQFGLKFFVTIMCYIPCVLDGSVSQCDWWKFDLEANSDVPTKSSNTFLLCKC